MMNEHPNVTMVRAHFEKMAAGDFPGVLADWRDDVVFHYNGNNEHRGDYAGKQAVIQFFIGLGTGSGGTFRLEPRKITALGDELVIQELDISMTWEGQSIAGVGVAVSRIADGKVFEIWDIPESTISLTEPDA